MKRNFFCIIFLALTFWAKGQPVSKQVNQIITFRLNAITVIDFSDIPSVRILSTEEFTQTRKSLVAPFKNPVVVASKKQPAAPAATYTLAPQPDRYNNPFYFTSSEISGTQKQVLHTASSH